MQVVTTVGLDIAKSVFQVHGSAIVMSALPPKADILQRKRHVG